MAESEVSDTSKIGKGRGGKRAGAGRPKGPQSDEDIDARKKAHKERRRIARRLTPRAKYSEVQPRMVSVECSVCGSIFEYLKSGPGSLRRFCTVSCRAVAVRKQAAESKERIAAGVRKNNYPEQVAPSRRYEFKCLVCAADYLATKSARGNKFCGATCRDEHHTRLRVELVQSKLKDVCCALCGETFRQTSKKQRFCSSKCKKTLENINKGHRRRARLGSGTVNPFEIFQRDNWLCQICGIATPRELRGTVKKRAPELDHIVPLSRGGDHSPENTRCTCRGCNARKGDKLDSEGVLQWLKADTGRVPVGPRGH